MACAERHNMIDQRLDALRDEGLNDVRLDRQPQARERANARRAAGDGKPDFRRADKTAVRLHALNAALLDAEAGDLTILDDVDAAFIGGAGIAPGDGVMTNRAAARLHQRATNWEPGIIEIGEWQIRAPGRE